MEDRAPLADRLRALATVFQERAWADPKAPNSGFLSDHAASLAEFAQQVEEEYAPLARDHEVPTNAQGVALARFLRAAFRDRAVGAHVCRGGAGLPDDYVYVRLTDGYEGGIAPDGRVST